MFQRLALETGRYRPGACVRAAWVFGLCLPVLGSMGLTNAQEWPEPVVVKDGLEFTLQPSVRTAVAGDPVVFFIRVHNTADDSGAPKRLCGRNWTTLTHESGTWIPDHDVCLPPCNCTDASPGTWLPAGKSVFWCVLLGVDYELKLSGRYTLKYQFCRGMSASSSVTLETTLDMAEPCPADRLAFEAIYTSEARSYAFLKAHDVLRSQFPTSRYAPYSDWMQWAQELGGPEKTYAGFLRFSQVHPDHPLASWGLLWGYKMAIRRGHSTWALRLETELVTHQSSSPAAAWIRDLYIK